MTVIATVTKTAAQSPYTPNHETDQVLEGDTTSGDVEFDLPSASIDGILFSFENVGTGANHVILDPSGSQLIGGETTLKLAAGQAVSVVSKNGGWKVKSDTRLITGPMVRVKDPRFGAKGDGIDDTAAVLEAAAYVNANGGTLVFDGPGTYAVTTSIVITLEGVDVYFERGAELRWTTATGTLPILHIKASKVNVWNPKIRGSGTRGNGVGILLVGDTAGVHDCTIVNPEIYRCDSSIEFGIVVATGASTGDCTVLGGALYESKAGIRSKGFTNRAYGTRIYRCDFNIDITNDRSSARFEGDGLVLSQWYSEAIRCRGGQGSSFHNTWMEHTDPAITPSSVVRVGGLIALGDATDREVVGLKFTGSTKVTTSTEEQIFRLDNCRDLLVEELVVSTNIDAPGVPPTRIVRAEATCKGKNNRLRRIQLYPGVQGFNTFDVGNYPIPLQNLGAGEVVIEEHFDVEDTQATDTIGGGCEPDRSATYTVFKEGEAVTKASGAQTGSEGMTLLVASVTGFKTNGRVMLPDVTKQGTYKGVQASPPALLNVSGISGSIPDGTQVAQAPTYFAKNRRGHIVAYGGDSYVAPLQSGLKTVLEAIQAHGTHIHFTGGGEPGKPRRFHFLDAPLGTEVGIAGVLDHPTFNDCVGLKLTGEGMDATIISNRTGFDALRTGYSLSGGSAPDTEPLNFTKCPHVEVMDMTVEGCGTYRSTTDAIDCDQSVDGKIVRVRVTRSRSRGIKFDDGNPGTWGGGNNVHDCVVLGRPDPPQIDARPGGGLVLGTQYRYCVTWVDRDSNAPNKSMETKPSDPTSFTAYTDTEPNPDVDYKTARVYAPAGPYSCTARKIYRSTAGGTWKLIATLTDPSQRYFEDNGVADGASAAFTKHSTIPQSGIEYLSSIRGGVCEANRVDGTGDVAPSDPTNGPNGEPYVGNPTHNPGASDPGAFGAVQHGINLNRKATFTHTNTPTNSVRVIGNRVRGTGGFGIRAGGANRNIIALNDVSNPGYSDGTRAGIRVENIADSGGTGITTSDRNLVALNEVYDDRDAQHPNGTAGMNYGVQVATSGSGAGTPTNTLVSNNQISGFLTAATDGVSGEWVRSGTIIVAANDSRDKAHADFICDGSGDQETLRAAEAALPSGGGILVLLDGTYTVSDAWRFKVPNSIIICGGTIKTSGSASGWIDKDVFHVGADTVDVHNLKVQGTGNLGEGILVQILRCARDQILSTNELTGTDNTFVITGTAADLGDLENGDEILLETTSLGGEIMVVGTWNPATEEYEGGLGAIGGSDPNSTMPIIVTRAQRGTTAKDFPAGTLVWILKGAHGCNVYSPRINNGEVGVEFGIAGTRSTGDCAIYNPDISACDLGVNARGFVNYAYGGYIRTCRTGITVSEDRPDAQLHWFGGTVLSWSERAILVERGHGSTFFNTWLEQSSSSPSGGAHGEIVRIGIDSAQNRQVLGVHFGGFTFVSPGNPTDNEDYVFNLHNCKDLTVDHLMISTNGDHPNSGGLPAIALVHEDAIAPATAIGNRFKRISIGPGFIPSQWDPSTNGGKLLLKEGEGEVIIEECPAPYRDEIGATLGGQTPTPSEADYIVDFKVVGNRTWFWAKGKNGHLEYISGDSPQTKLVTADVTHSGVGKTILVENAKDFPASGTIYMASTDKVNPASGDPPSTVTQNPWPIAYTSRTDTQFEGCTGGSGDSRVGEYVAIADPNSGLKEVLEAIVQDGTHVHFLGKTYRFPIFPNGGNADSDHAAFQFKSGITFSGEGMGSTVVANWGAVQKEDTEPLSIDETCHRVAIRDMELYSGGYEDENQSSDVVDFDHASESLVERVLIRRSRARGIVIDGKDAPQSNNNPGGWKAKAVNSVIRECVVRGRPEPPDLQWYLATGGNIAAGTYRYMLAWVDCEPSGPMGSGHLSTTALCFGETICSDDVEITIPAAQGGQNNVNRIRVQWYERMPQYDSTHGVTKLLIYRRSATQGWRLLTTITDPNQRMFEDSVADATIAANAQPDPGLNASLIPQQGVDLLAGENHNVVDNVVEATMQHGIRSAAVSNRPNSIGHTISRNRVRRTLQHGIMISSGIACKVVENTVSNVGRNGGSGTAKACVRVEPRAATTGEKADRTMIHDNQFYDDQDANSLAGGPTISWGVDVRANATRTSVKDNKGNVSPNSGSAFVNGAVIDAGTSTIIEGNDMGPTYTLSGTGTKVRQNEGYNPQGAITQAPGASPWTYTAGFTPEVLYFHGGTITSITKNGRTIAVASPACVYLEPGEQIVVTYTAAPTVERDRK